MPEKGVSIDLSGGLLDVLRQAEEKGLDAAATERMYHEYFSFHTRKKAVPYHGSFELTPLCNDAKGAGRCCYCCWLLAWL